MLALIAVSRTSSLSSILYHASHLSMLLDEDSSHPEICLSLFPAYYLLHDPFFNQLLTIVPLKFS